MSKLYDRPLLYIFPPPKKKKKLFCHPERSWRKESAYKKKKKKIVVVVVFDTKRFIIVVGYNLAEVTPTEVQFFLLIWMAFATCQQIMFQMTLVFIVSHQNVYILQENVNFVIFLIFQTVFCV